MSRLQHIKENYSLLLYTLKEAGVTFTESQKENLDKFVLAIEESIDNGQKTAIKATERIVRKKLEAEYKTVFESIFKNMEMYNDIRNKLICKMTADKANKQISESVATTARLTDRMVSNKLSREYKRLFESILKNIQLHTDMTNKILCKMTTANAKKQIAESVDTYLTTVLKDALPKKHMVDYTRMLQLENTYSKLKDILMVNDKTIAKKRKELAEAYASKQNEQSEKIALLEKRLNESISREQNLVRKIDRINAKSLLEKKTKNLPLFEATQIKKRLENASCKEVEDNFKALLDSIREEMKRSNESEEDHIENEINNIINGNTDKEISQKEEKTEKQIKRVLDDEDDSEDFSNALFDEDDDDTLLDESANLQIPSGLMKNWIYKLKSINTNF